MNTIDIIAPDEAGHWLFHVIPTPSPSHTNIWSVRGKVTLPISVNVGALFWVQDGRNVTNVLSEADWNPVLYPHKNIVALEPVQYGTLAFAYQPGGGAVVTQTYSGTTDEWGLFLAGVSLATTMAMAIWCKRAMNYMEPSEGSI